MGVNENPIELHFNSEVAALGGITYKWVSPGRANVPDRIAILNGNVYFVEVKPFDKDLNTGQRRELRRLASYGANVYAVIGRQGVNTFIEMIKNAPAAKRLLPIPA